MQKLSCICTKNQVHLYYNIYYSTWQEVYIFFNKNIFRKEYLNHLNIYIKHNIMHTKNCQMGYPILTVFYFYYLNEFLVL